MHFTHNGVNNSVSQLADNNVCPTIILSAPSIRCQQGRTFAAVGNGQVSVLEVAFSNSRQQPANQLIYCRLLPVKENFLCRQVFKVSDKHLICPQARKHPSIEEIAIRIERFSI